MANSFLIAIVAILILLIAGIIGFYVAGNKSEALGKVPNKKAIILYLVFAIILSCGGLIALHPALRTSMAAFFGLQLAYLGLGWLAAYYYNRGRSQESVRGDYSDVLFIAVNTLFGILGFGLVYNYFYQGPTTLWFALTVLAFTLPLFVKKLFWVFMTIPEDIHKLWYYPVRADKVQYDNIDPSEIFMLKLEYSKSIKDPKITDAILRAPKSMKFADWFRSYIEHQNQKDEAEHIQYLAQDRSPQGWMFVLKGNFFKGGRFVDPEKTILENKISEKDVVQAKRVEKRLK